MADAKLGGAIKEKLNIPCIFDDSAQQLMRGLRNQIEELVEAASGSEMKSMAIGLAHSLSRYKLKFSPDKVDTMIVQAQGWEDLHICLPAPLALPTCIAMLSQADASMHAHDVPGPAFRADGG